MELSEWTLNALERRGRLSAGCEELRFKLDSSGKKFNLKNSRGGYSVILICDRDLKWFNHYIR